MPKSQRSFLGFVRSAACAGTVLAACGCGSNSDLSIGSDVQDSAAALCVTSDQTPVVGSLLHRYSFSGTGSTIADSVAGADGQSATPTGAPAQLDGSGQLTLDGVTDYVDLPSGLISSLGSTTIVVWTAWRSGGPAYQRVFDFGTSTLGAGQRSQCLSCLLLMVYSGDQGGDGLCAQVHVPNTADQQIVTSQRLDKTFRQVALAFESRNQMTLYLDGTPIGSTPITVALSEIMDDNDWLGLSQYSSDTNYAGAYDEVRIYDHALNPCEVKATFDSGPDAL